MPSVSKAITRDLRARYGERYRIVRSMSGADALATLEEFQRRDQPVALIVSDHRMPEMTGIDFLERSITLAPGAKLVLLTAYADTDVAIKAINDIGLDHYLMKPWAPPEERLFPIVDDLLADWERANDNRFDGIRIVGNRWSERSYDTRMFLARNHVHYQWLELERDPEAQRLHGLFGAAERALPVGAAARRDGARRAGRARAGRRVGPAYARRVDALRPRRGRRRTRRSRRRRVRRIRGAAHRGDRARRARWPGRRRAARIENYLGFPNGLSGADLSQRAMMQAQRLGAEMVFARSVESLVQRGNVHAVCFADGTEIEARAVVIATGVSYRRMGAEGLAELTGRGVYYGASASDARGTEGDDVYIVGAANSAGQAALHLARVRTAGRHARCVAPRSPPRCRRTSWTGSIAADNIEVRLQTEVVRGGGTDHLEWLELVDVSTGQHEEVKASFLYVFIGASPHTDWLGDTIARDERGFILTGPDVVNLDRDRWRWPHRRPPFLLETSRPGVFAAGDVRLASMKRVASAVGEGSSAVSNVHLYLETV